jgi:hypothetical protein
VALRSTDDRRLRTFVARSKQPSLARHRVQVVFRFRSRAYSQHVPDALSPRLKKALGLELRAATSPTEGRHWVAATDWPASSFTHFQTLVSTLIQDLGLTVYNVVVHVDGGPPVGSYPIEFHGCCTLLTAVWSSVESQFRRLTTGGERAKIGGKRGPKST